VKSAAEPTTAVESAAEATTAVESAAAEATATVKPATTSAMACGHRRRRREEKGDSHQCSDRNPTRKCVHRSCLL
jgi:hypothetical protein